MKLSVIQFVHSYFKNIIGLISVINFSFLSLDESKELCNDFVEFKYGIWISLFMNTPKKDMQEILQHSRSLLQEKVDCDKLNRGFKSLTTESEPLLFFNSIKNNWKNLSFKNDLNEMKKLRLFRNSSCIKYSVRKSLLSSNIGKYQQFSFRWYWDDLQDSINILIYKSFNYKTEHKS